MIDMKTCTKCGETKPLDEYNRDKSKPDGRRPNCRSCSRSVSRANRDRYRDAKRDWRQRNKDAIRTQRAEYRERRRGELAEYLRRYREENRERIAEQNRDYQLRNREAIKAWQKEYRKENHDHIAALSREYAQRNPEVGWGHGYRSRAKRHGFDPVVEDFTKPDVIEQYGNSCFYCGGDFEELDHYVPVSKGGPHTLANVRPSCSACNRAKYDKTDAEWGGRVSC